MFRAEKASVCLFTTNKAFHCKHLSIVMECLFFYQLRGYDIPRYRLDLKRLSFDFNAENRHDSHHTDFAFLCDSGIVAKTYSDSFVITFLDFLYFAMDYVWWSNLAVEGNGRQRLEKDLWWTCYRL
jgi:hypothetical protein